MASRTLIVKAIAAAPISQLHPDDQGIRGSYEVELSDQVPEHLLGDAALDVFHGAVAVTILDDFHFEVWQGEMQLLPSPSEDGYRFADEGKVISGPWTAVGNGGESPGDRQ